MTAAPIRADVPEGAHDMRAEVYHADPCAEPSLSSSTIVTLLTRSPRHAWMKSPRLNPDFEPDNDKKYDIGTAAHALFLEGRDSVVVIDAPDFRTSQAKVLRDRAYAIGKTPLLTHQYDEVQAMVAAIRPQLDAHVECDAFSNGKPEQTLIWREDDVWCRARPDWLNRNHAVIDDYKTTSGSAHPEAETRRLFGMNADIQSAWYRRGLKALGLHKSPRFRFISQETRPPYALSVLEFSEAADELANRRIDQIIDLWRWCLNHDRWPGYAAQVCTMSPPVWRERAQMEDEIRADQTASLSMKQRMMDWQAPHREKNDAV